jgi:hypothetical protein
MSSLSTQTGILCADRPNLALLPGEPGIKHLTARFQVLPSFSERCFGAAVELTTN